MRNIFVDQTPFAISGWARSGWGMPIYQGEEPPVAMAGWVRTGWGLPAYEGEERGEIPQTHVINTGGRVPSSWGTMVGPQLGALFAAPPLMGSPQPMVRQVPLRGY